MAVAWNNRSWGGGLGAAKPRLAVRRVRAAPGGAALAGLRRLRALLMIASQSSLCSGPRQSPTLAGTRSRAAWPKEAKDGWRPA
jgi:hypothetical protein